MEKVEELLGSHPVNVLNRLQEGGAGVPEPVICPSTGSTPKKEMADGAGVRVTE